ncbi:ArsR/SmtB family transcription factor [Novosphingobium profundi]|uniref:ArsR/SmtB family transcription factor n=1 Tax=Novosphingobium profundi TaxID=1774954 RepID=UPI001FE642B3|nr:metalloregulator ArsR/SmtB family transcription factor [Novosphingobium profundi]
MMPDEATRAPELAGEPPIELIKAIAHPLRYAILACVARGERNVGEIEAATGIGQPTLSQQLSVLRGAGLVSARREAKLVFYAVEPEALEQVCTAFQVICPAEFLGRIRDKLAGGAPLPAPVTSASEAPGGSGAGLPLAQRRRGGAAVFARLD